MTPGQRGDLTAALAALPPLRPGVIPNPELGREGPPAWMLDDDGRFDRTGGRP